LSLPLSRRRSTNILPQITFHDRKVEILFAPPVPTMSCDFKTPASPGEIQGRTGAATNKTTDLSDDLNAVALTLAPAPSTADMLGRLVRIGDYQGLTNLIDKLSVEASSAADRERALVGLLSDAIAKTFPTNTNAEAEDTDTRPRTSSTASAKTSSRLFALAATRLAILGSPTSS
jgi:hypothetical protein